MMGEAAALYFLVPGVGVKVNSCVMVGERSADSAPHLNGLLLDRDTDGSRASIAVPAPLRMTSLRRRWDLR